MKRNRGATMAAVVLLMAHLAAATEPGARWAILITGVSGDPQLQDMYLKELTELRSVLEERMAIPRDGITVLFDDPARDSALIQHKSTRSDLQDVCRRLAAAVNQNDLVFVYIGGHGNYDGETYKLNLVGPDPTAAELASMLYSIPAGRFVIVNTTSCSGGSLGDLSQKGSIVITATRSGMEKNQTSFGRYFIEALGDDAADTDRNRRLSVAEAFLYANRKVEEHYKTEGKLQTEHPVLEDNGDGKAESRPAPENGEGLLAMATFLDAGTSDAAGSLTAEQQRLSNEAREVEAEIEALKYEKAGMSEAEYERRLEELLIRLAKINARLQK
ncbi:MAG: hypothetical protein GXX84_13500 [Acidobacteria bacterium]|nr:hypothetical protein [Acidobacteriota bacterium]